MKTLRIIVEVIGVEQNIREHIIAFFTKFNVLGIEEEETQVSAYFSDDISLFNKILQEFKVNFKLLNYTMDELEEKNWNEIWESSFEPVIISDKCIIKAPFHQIDEKYDFVLEIMPKMSFGTGHHETTALMIEKMLNQDFKGKNILDMGCGTGVLSILASFIGAQKITAIDFDEWAYKNTIENLENNNVKNVEVYKGSIEKVGGQIFDFILANINRNIILEQLLQYYSSLSDTGTLIVSGILDQDFNVVSHKAEQVGFKKISCSKKQKWCLIEFCK